MEKKNNIIIMAIIVVVIVVIIGIIVFLLNNNKDTSIDNNKTAPDPILTQNETIIDPENDKNIVNQPEDKKDNEPAGTTQTPIDGQLDKITETEKTR